MDAQARYYVNWRLKPEPRTELLCATKLAMTTTGSYDRIADFTPRSIVVKARLLTDNQMLDVVFPLLIDQLKILIREQNLAQSIKPRVFCQFQSIRQSA